MLIERIATYKSYVNYPGYDLLAVQPDQGSVARVQVKSRFRTDWDGFIIKNLDCDFVVFVALNRGFDRPKRDGARGISDPQFYVLPINYVISVRDPKNKWGKVVRARLKDIEAYRDQWNLIATFLNAGS